MNEDELQTNVVDAARRLGFLVYHTHDSRHSAAGFPDLVMVHRWSGGVIWAELKSARGRVSAEQAAWLQALSEGNREVHVWRPEHWPDRVVDVLRRVGHDGAR